MAGSYPAISLAFQLDTDSKIQLSEVGTTFNKDVKYKDAKYKCAFYLLINTILFYYFHVAQ